MRHPNSRINNGRFSWGHTVLKTLAVVCTWISTQQHRHHHHHSHGKASIAAAASIVPTGGVSGWGQQQQRHSAPAHKLPFAIHDEIIGADGVTVVGYEFQAYSSQPIGLTFNGSFHVTGFEAEAEAWSERSQVKEQQQQQRLHRGAAQSTRRNGNSGRRPTVSLARLSGYIRLDDQLVAVNNRMLEGETFAEFTTIVQRATATPPVSYHFRRQEGTHLQSSLRRLHDDAAALASGKPLTSASSAVAGEGDDRSRGDSLEPLLHLWRATGTGLPRRHKPSAGGFSAERWSGGELHLLDWNELGQALPFVPAKFSGRLLTQHRYRLVEVSPTDGCAKSLTLCSDTNCGRAGQRKSRNRRPTASSPPGRDNIHADSVNGSIVLVDRGGCSFDVKTHNAFDAGAAGIIVINSDDQPIEMDSPHMSHFTTPTSSSSIPRTEQTRRGRKTSRKPRTKSRARHRKKAQSKEEAIVVRPDETKVDGSPSTSVLFPVLSVGKRDGEILRKLLDPKARKSVASIFVEATMPPDHPLRETARTVSGAGPVQVPRKDPHEVVPTHSGELVLFDGLDEKATGTDLIGDAKLNHPLSKLIAKSSSPSSSTPLKIDVGIHFLASSFGAPVFAHQSIPPKNRQNATSPADGVAVALADARANLNALLCEPMLLAARNCPPDLHRAVRGAYVVLDSDSVDGSASSNTSRREETQPAECSIYDRLAMVQICGAVGAIVETHETTLRPLPPPSDAVSDLHKNVEKDAAVFVDVEGAVTGGRDFEFTIRVVTVTQRGADLLRHHILARCSSWAADEFCGARFSLQHVRAHAHAWEHLADLQEHRAWPPEDEGRKLLLTRLHRRFGHSEEHVAAMVAAARNHGYGDAVDEVVIQRQRAIEAKENARDVLWAAASDQSGHNARGPILGANSNRNPPHRHSEL